MYKIRLLELTPTRRILIVDCRKEVGLYPGDIVEAAVPIRSYASNCNLFSILLQIHNFSPSPILVIRNQGLILDHHFRKRIDQLVQFVEAESIDWALMAPTGIELDHTTHSCIYPSATPRLFFTRRMRPIVDAALDLILVNPAQILDVAEAPDFPSLCDSSLIQALILSGYLKNRVSVYTPYLACGINGHEIGRSHVEHESKISSIYGGDIINCVLPSLSGPINIGNSDRLPTVRDMSGTLSPGAQVDIIQKIYSTVSRYCTQFSLSIVTRTQFRRMHLLRRLLTSVTRGRSDDVPVEIVLATDVEPATAEAIFLNVRAEFPELDIRLVFGDPSQAPSRVANLLAGIQAAALRYIAVVDDDDYVDVSAFEAMKNVTFLDDEPIVIMASGVVQEVWEETPLKRHVLANHQHREVYWPDRWRKMFNGVNQLPICALVTPARWTRSRISSFEFRHDLSEDYTLHLLLLTAPDVPRVHEISSILCHISIRDDQSNTVTLEDRRPWVRDISNHLIALLLENSPVASGTIQLLSGARGEQAPHTVAAGSIETREQNKRLHDEIAGLQREIRALRDIISAREEVLKEAGQNFSQIGEFK